MNRRRAVAAAIAALLLLLCALLFLRGGAPPADVGTASEPTYALAELPSMAPPVRGGPPADSARASGSDGSDATDRPGSGRPGSGPTSGRRRPPPRGLPSGGLGEDPRPAPAPPPTPTASAGSPLRVRLEATGAEPEHLLRVLDEATPEELRAHVDDLAARARPDLRYLYSFPPDAPREQLAHLALLGEAIAYHDALRDRYGARIPLLEAVELAGLNLAVAARGLNSPEHQQAIDTEITRAAGQQPKLERIDELFASAQSELDRVTQPGPPPADPMALALKQASAYYRVQALAALRLQVATGRPVAGMGGALERR